MHDVRSTLRALNSALIVFVLGSVAAKATAQPPAPRITISQAETTARQHVPDALVEEIELDHEGGRQVYEVELRDARGVEHEIVIDADDGHIIRAGIDD